MPNLRPSQIVVLAAGVVLFLCSFLEYSDGGDNRWSDFGILTLPALIGLVAAIAVAVRAFADVQLPDRILTFTIDQLLLVLAVTALLVDVGLYFVADNVGGDLKLGFWLSAIGSLALVVGTVMELLADPTARPATGPSATPPSPF